MYFPTDEERRWLRERLLPEARRQGVAEELRGWSWARPPLLPVYDVPLGVYEVAGRYCPTGRDVYLARVQHRVGRPNTGMVHGRVLHGLVEALLVEAKRRVYQHGAECLRALGELREWPLPPVDRLGLEAADAQELWEKASAVRAYLVREIEERVQRVLAAQPRVGADGLAALALPVQLELKLNGTYLGLSRHLSADALLPRERVVVDLKFGPREEFHRLATTGYALVLESLDDVAVDVGCVVYVGFARGRVVIERDYHVIGDELRHWFMQERDEKARLVAEEIDPGLPERCPATCPYLRHCRPGAARLPNGSVEPTVANPQASEGVAAVRGERPGAEMAPGRKNGASQTSPGEDAAGGLANRAAIE